MALGVGPLCHPLTSAKIALLDAWHIPIFKLLYAEGEGLFCVYAVHLPLDCFACFLSFIFISPLDFIEFLLCL